MTYAEFLDIARGFAFIIGTIAALIAIITALVAWRQHWVKQIMDTLVITGNAFAKKVLPGILEKFEEKELAPKGTLRTWTEILSDELLSKHSIKRLSERGEEILRDSGITEIIDKHYDHLVAVMEEHDLTTAVDIEEAAFYALFKYEDTEVLKQIHSWLYNYPNADLSTVIFVGSFYLRDQYLASHQEILKNDISLRKDNST